MNEPNSIKNTPVDVNENRILEADPQLLSLLLSDKTTGKNILWMTDNYSKKGKGYEETSEITADLVTGKNSLLIKHRTSKSQKEQLYRVKDKAEIFTPSWICNKQNNLIDNAWFGEEGVFNLETSKGWESTKEPICFPEGKTWKDYVLATRLEVSCGEAPYLVSRYDATSGEFIAINDRIGFLDRKMRIVGENTTDREAWLEWSKKAVQSVYAFEWQGDNLLLARENIVLSYFDYYRSRFSGEFPPIPLLVEIAEIAAWNIWQMDGIKFVVPMSCHAKIEVEQDLFEGDKEIAIPCEGCKTGNIKKHNGVYCKIKDWQKDKILTAISMLRG